MSRPAIEIRAPRAGDAEALAAEMRPQDVDEVEAARGPGSTLQAVQDGIDASTMCWTAEDPTGLVAIFGLVPLTLMGDTAVPWMLGTTRVDRHAGSLIRLAPSYIARMLAAYPRLLNAVDSRNAKACRWLRRAGFSLGPPMPMGPAGVLFHPFQMDVRDV